MKECSLALKNICIISVPATPSDIAISPNSELIALCFRDKSTVIVYDVKGKLVARMQDESYGLTGILWAPDSVELIAFS